MVVLFVNRSARL